MGADKGLHGGVCLSCRCMPTRPATRGPTLVATKATMQRPRRSRGHGACGAVVWRCCWPRDLPATCDAPSAPSRCCAAMQCCPCNCRRTRNDTARLPHLTSPALPASPLTASGLTHGYHRRRRCCMAGLAASAGNSWFASNGPSPPPHCAKGPSR